jgi:hypothetical protein
VTIQNWQRWFTASIFQYLKPRLGPDLVYLETDERKTSKASAWYELRVDGLQLNELVGGIWRAEIDVNIVCSCATDDNLYKIDTMLGTAMDAMIGPIPVFQTGADFDNNTAYGCLNLMTNGQRNGITPHKFGQIAPSIKLIQASSSARYWMEPVGG